MLRLNIFLFSFLISYAAAAHTGYLSGLVKDKSSGEPLIGTTIYIREISIGAVTDIFGRYSLAVKPGKYTLEISYIGYRTEFIEFEIKEHETKIFDAELNPGAIQLADLVIVSNSQSQRTNYLSSVDIGLRPVNSSQEVLRMIPGLVIAQHAGGGKAEQIFLRGFDIDHGTDINLTVDGMPVNMVSHAHGQGYSDLHFLIPETIRDVDFEKGPYDAAKGDFATAGYASFNTIPSLEKNLMKVEAGQFGMFRNVNMIRLLDNVNQDKKEQLYVATEFSRTDGYFESPQDFARLNGLIKYYHRINDKRLLSISASGFTSQWNSSGQIPERAVNSGMITRFGSIDNAEGGKTSRYNLNFSLTQKYGKNILQQHAYASIYNFDLLSNFTFYLNDPVNGDRIRQKEARKIVGYTASLERKAKFHSVEIASEYSAGIRYDVVEDSELSRVLDWNTVLDPISRGDIRQSNIFLYSSQSMNFGTKFSVAVGLRLDHLGLRYTDHVSEPVQVTEIQKTLLSPKITVDYDVTALTKLFLKAGYGFHSNDVRSIATGTSDLIAPKAFGMDLGTEWKPFPDMFIQASLWFLDLEEELVYVGDEGITEPSGATRRKGIDLSVRYQLMPELFADADFNFTNPRQKNTERQMRYIPLAPTITSMGGLHYKHEKFNSSLRYRYVGDRPANEDNSLTADGYFLIDALFNYKIKRFTFSFSVENILNKEWKEAQFETESRLQHEAEPVTEIHFTPGTPRFIKAGIQIEF